MPVQIRDEIPRSPDDELTQEDANREQEGPEAVTPLLKELEQLAHLATRYAQLGAERYRIGFRRLVLKVIFACFAVIALMASAVYLLILFLQGIAGFLSSLFPQAPWAGPLILGPLLLALAIVATYVGLKLFSHQQFRRLQRHYGNEHTERS